jgi:Tfp pilus assembly protein PilF
MLKRDENSGELHLALARIYRESQRLNQAVEEAQQALELSPRLPLAHYELGLDYVRLDRMKDACEEFEREIAGNPSSFQAHYALAQCDMNYRQSYDQAARNFEKVIALRPGHVDSFMGLAKAEFRLGQFEHAEQTLRRVIELDPRRGEAHYLLAQVYQKSGRDADAAREFSLASQLKAEKRQREYRELREKMSEEPYVAR